MKTKAITIRIDDETEKIIEDIISNVSKRHGYYNYAKSQVILAAIREFSKVELDTQVKAIVDVICSDGRRRYTLT